VRSSFAAEDEGCGASVGIADRASVTGDEATSERDPIGKHSATGLLGVACVRIA
jgi:hypothetical protein